jgi:D-arabinose 1-dehydrogenase-like Zn-dependent alcohol dehydrogenase
MTLKDRGVALPLTMGHEISGEVVKAGPDAKGVKPGMSCVVYPWLGCGECPTCRRGEENLCAVKARAMGVFMPGGYAEYVLVPHERYCVDLASSIRQNRRPGVLSVTTYSAFKKFGSKIRTSLSSLGAGGLGHMALTVLRARQGAVVVDTTQERWPPEAGAPAAIDGTAPDASQRSSRQRAWRSERVSSAISDSQPGHFASIKNGGKSCSLVSMAAS